MVKRYITDIPKLNGTEKMFLFVLQELTLQAKDYGYDVAIPLNYQQIMDKTNISRQTVAIVVRNLCKAGLIEVVAGSGKASSTYRLTLDGKGRGMMLNTFVLKSNEGYLCEDSTPASTPEEALQYDSRSKAEEAKREFKKKYGLDTEVVSLLWTATEDMEAEPNKRNRYPLKRVKFVGIAE